MQEWLHMAGGHNKVEYCPKSHLKESSFRSKDLSLALALSLGRGLRRIVARVPGVLGAPPPKNSTVASCVYPPLLLQAMHNFCSYCVKALLR